MQKKDVTTEKNDEVKNSKEKQEITCNEIALWKDSNEFFYS